MGRRQLWVPPPFLARFCRKKLDLHSKWHYLRTMRPPSSRPSLCVKSPTELNFDWDSVFLYYYFCFQLALTSWVLRRVVVVLGAWRPRWTLPRWVWPCLRNFCQQRLVSVRKMCSLAFRRVTEKIGGRGSKGFRHLDLVWNMFGTRIHGMESFQTNNLWKRLLLHYRPPFLMLQPNLDFHRHRCLRLRHLPLLPLI